MVVAEVSVQQKRKTKTYIEFDNKALLTAVVSSSQREQGNKGLQVYDVTESLKAVSSLKTTLIVGLIRNICFEH